MWLPVSNKADPLSATDHDLQPIICGVFAMRTIQIVACMCLALGLSSAQRCTMLLCEPGFELVGADSRGCGGTCANLCKAASPTCPKGDPGSNCMCPMVYSPVCGCDGVMYSNTCMRACAGAFENNVAPLASPSSAPSVTALNPVKKSKTNGKRPKRPMSGPGPVVNSSKGGG
jgi:hypothetical protein